MIPRRPCPLQSFRSPGARHVIPAPSAGPGRKAGWIGAAVLLALAAGCTATQGIADNRSERYSFPDAPHIYHLASFGSVHDIQPPSGFVAWVLGESPGDKDARVISPYGIAAGKGRVYINDGRAISGYWMFDLAANTLKLIRHPSLRGSTGIAVDDRDFKYLAVPRLLKAKSKGTLGTEAEEGAIVVFDPNNAPVREAVFPGRPIGIAVWKNRLFVTDAVHHRVVILDKSTLKILRSFGKAGGGDTEFRFPKAIAVDRDGRINVGDTFNGRIKVFNQNGDLHSRFGHRSRVLGSFMNLTGISVDREGRVYAVDSNAIQKILNEEVQVLDSSRFYFKGEPVPSVDAKEKERKKAVFGYFQKPNGVGDFKKIAAAGRATLYRPTGIAVDYKNIAYFKGAFPPDSNLRIEYLIWLTSEAAYNGRNISVFAFVSQQ